MKILFIITSLDVGGVERECVELIKGLPKNQYECELITLKDIILYPEIYDTKCKLYILNKNVTSKFKLWLNILRIIKAGKPDIIQSWDTQSSLYICLLAFLFRIPLVNYSIQDAKKARKFSKSRILSKLTFFFSDFVISNSVAGLKVHGLEPSTKFKYIPNGYDFKRRKVNHSKEQMKDKLNLSGQYIIGMVARFTVQKDYETFIKATQIIASKKKDVSVVLMGDGPMLNDMKALVSVDSVDQFRFLGKITAVEEYINIFDIHCLISNTNLHGEGTANSILEGMAMGKPIVATDCGGNKEVVLNGITGYIIDPFNVEQLVEKLEFLLENESIRISMGKKGQERLEKEFSLSNWVANCVNLYEQAVLK